MSGYTYAELERNISELVSRHPWVSTGSIGKSLVGRSLPFLSIGKGKKSVLYVGAHHGMESITSLLLMKYANDYCEAIDEGKKHFGVGCDYLFSERTVYIVPMLNPDGIELQIKGNDPLNPLSERLDAMSGGDFSRWQANGRGVDLNHNYNAGFAEYKPIERELGINGGGPTRYSGEYPESEPECASLVSFIRTADPLLMLALHTQGGEIYADYNGYMPKGAEQIARRMSSLCGYTVARPEKAACYGGLKDYFILEYDRPGFTMECGKGVNPLPLDDCNIIYSVIKGVLFSLPSMV